MRDMLNWVNEEENALKQVINAMKKQNIHLVAGQKETNNMRKEQSITTNNNQMEEKGMKSRFIHLNRGDSCYEKNCK